MGFYKIEWQGKLPISCEICEKQDLEIFVDGTSLGGGWGMFCPDCYETHGTGEFGVGLGQMYNDKRELLKGAPKFMEEGD